MPEGGPGKQITTTGVDPGNISRWKLISPQKFEFEERGYFGTIKRKLLQNRVRTSPRPPQVHDDIMYIFFNNCVMSNSHVHIFSIASS